MNFLNIAFVLFTYPGLVVFLFGFFQYMFQVLKSRLWTIRPYSLKFIYKVNEKKIIKLAHKKIIIGAALVLMGSLFKGLFLKYIEVLLNISIVVIVPIAWLFTLKHMLLLSKVRYEIVILGKKNNVNMLLYKSAFKKMLLGALVFCGLICLKLIL